MMGHYFALNHIYIFTNAVCRQTEQLGGYRIRRRPSLLCSRQWSWISPALTVKLYRKCRNHDGVPYIMLPYRSSQAEDTSPLTLEE